MCAVKQSVVWQEEDVDADAAGGTEAELQVGAGVMLGVLARGGATGEPGPAGGGATTVAGAGGGRHQGDVEKAGGRRGAGIPAEVRERG